MPDSSGSRGLAGGGRSPLTRRHRTVVGEGRVARHHVVERGAEAVDVVARVGRLSERLLETNVRRCARDDGGGAVAGRLIDRDGLVGDHVDGLLAGDVLGQAPVDEGCLAARTDQDVGRVDVAVDDAALVRRGLCLGDRHEVGDELDPLAGARPAVLFLGFGQLGQHLAQRSPLDPLEHAERRPLVALAELVDGDDRRVLQASQHQRLAAQPDLELAPGLRVERMAVDVVGARVLEDHVARQAPVARLEHDSHPARGQRLVRPVERALTDEGGGRGVGLAHHAGMIAS